MTVLQKRVKAGPQRHLSPENDSQSPTSAFLANFRFANHFPIIPSFVMITSSYPINLN